MISIPVWIKNHQVPAFFLLAFAITWPGLILVFFIYPGNEIVEILCSQVVFGPALAVMLVSAIVEPSPGSARNPRQWVVFGTAWVLAASVQILYFWKVNRADLSVPLVIIGCIFALFPARVLSCAFARTPGLRSRRWVSTRSGP